MNKLRVLVDGEWHEVDVSNVEFIQDDEPVSADLLSGEVVDGEIVLDTVPSLPTEAQLRREQLRKEAAWVDE